MLADFQNSDSKFFEIVLMTEKYNCYNNLVNELVCEVIFYMGGNKGV